MLTLTAFLLWSAIQDPQPTRVQVTLKDGAVLEGQVVQDTKDYLELRLDGNTVVGFERIRVAGIAPVAAVATGPVEPAAGAAQREEWYVLHDAEGRLVGRVQCTESRGARIRLAEEWEFADAGTRTEVSVVEVLDAERRPVSCFFRERTRAKDEERLRSERVVRAEVQGQELVVEHSSLLAGAKRRYPLPAGLRFPLELRASLRGTPALPESLAFPVFDPQREELLQVEYAHVPRRRILHEGKSLEVRELIRRQGRLASSEWLTATGSTLRREVNGSALVAVPSSEERARGLTQWQAALFPAALRREAQGRFALTLPNPNWTFLDGDDGQVRAVARGEGASASLLILDHLEKGLLLDSAADAVQRWFTLVQPEVRFVRRQPATVRQLRALCLEGTCDRVADGHAVEHRIALHVIATKAGFLALLVSAPKERFAALQDDFQRLLQGIEPDPEALRPPPADPVREASAPRNER